MALSASVLTPAEPVEEDEHAAEEDHPAEHDEVEGHRFFSLAEAAIARATSNIQVPTPTTANVAENPRSDNAWPKINAPAETFAASFSVSASSDRCDPFNPTIVVDGAVLQFLPTRAVLPGFGRRTSNERADRRGKSRPLDSLAAMRDAPIDKRWERQTRWISCRARWTC